MSSTVVDSPSDAWLLTGFVGGERGTAAIDVGGVASLRLLPTFFFPLIRPPNEAFDGMTSLPSAAFFSNKQVFQVKTGFWGSWLFLRSFKPINDHICSHLAGSR